MRNPCWVSWSAWPLSVLTQMKTSVLWPMNMHHKLSTHCIVWQLSQGCSRLPTLPQCMSHKPWLLFSPLRVHWEVQPLSELCICPGLEASPGAPFCPLFMYTSFFAPHLQRSGTVRHNMHLTGKNYTICWADIPGVWTGWFNLFKMKWLCSIMLPQYLKTWSKTNSLSCGWLHGDVLVAQDSVLQ